MKGTSLGVAILRIIVLVGSGLGLLYDSLGLGVRGVSGTQDSVSELLKGLGCKPALILSHTV